ncbi:MAG: hypothetical protein IKY41_06380 [Clostridia bacterium]|nr:hypothetical protein [Clostridia bacterium]
MQEKKPSLSLYELDSSFGNTIYPIRNDEDTVLELEWVARMNNIRSRVIEIVNSELIYA